MRHLFLDPSRFGQEFVRIDGQDFHHLINVLRLRQGERLVLLNNLGYAWEAELELVERKAATARILVAAQVPAEPTLRVTVAQAIGKGDRFDQVVQHGTEIGATAFLPLITERTISRPTAGACAEKVLKWSQVAKGAAEQAGRSIIPVVMPMVDFRELLNSKVTQERRLLLLDGSGAAMTAEQTSGELTLLVGPEGGFTSAEVERAITAGAVPVRLGPYVLRTETAALAALSRLLAEF